MYETNLHYIAAEAIEKEEENDHFLRSLRWHDGVVLDKKVHAINKRVSAAIDCTQCGNCCKTLVVNITEPEIKELAVFLEKTETDVRETYIEQSLQGQCYINTTPCCFLDNKKCSIYANRFTECRDFPHLHKPGFRERFLGTLLHYGSCPIIYNVVEELKEELDFLIV